MNNLDKIFRESNGESKKFVKLYSSYLSILLTELDSDSVAKCIDQMEDYVKFHSTTYINMIITSHDYWMIPMHCCNFPLPMKFDPIYVRSREQVVPLALIMVFLKYNVANTLTIYTLLVN